LIYEFSERGLRLNRDLHQLWYQYFKLELIYVEKIKAHRRILGISNNKDEESNEGQEISKKLGLDHLQEINLIYCYVENLLK